MSSAFGGSWRGGVARMGGAGGGRCRLIEPDGPWNERAVALFTYGTRQRQHVDTLNKRNNNRLQKDIRTSVFVVGFKTQHESPIPTSIERVMQDASESLARTGSGWGEARAGGQRAGLREQLLRHVVRRRVGAPAAQGARERAVVAGPADARVEVHHALADRAQRDRLHLLEQLHLLLLLALRHPHALHTRHTQTHRYEYFE